MSGSWSGEQLLEALRVAGRALERQSGALNALNVFPVPDGDTGTNMALTLNSALRDVAPDPSCAVVAERVGYWATMRGRGNSGIILSQVLRGVAAALQGHRQMGPHELAAALAHGSARAYAAVLRPVEGTMLTVIRSASDAAQAVLHAGEATLHAVLDAAVREARAAVQRTPSLLPELRQAGVVDAGGQGLLVVLEALLRYARGEPALAGDPLPHARPAPSTHHADGFGFCTSFVLRGAALPVDELRAAFAALGESLVVAGDADLVRIHLHTPRPGDALNRAVELGTLDAVEIANMDLQHAARQMGAEARPAGVAVVAAAAGPGFAALLHDLGADVVLEGAPPPEALLAAAEERQLASIVLAAGHPPLPTSAGRVAWLETPTPAHAVAALLARRYQGDLDENVRLMTAAIRRVRVAALDGSDPSDAELAALLGGEVELAAIYVGESAAFQRARALAARLAALSPELSVEIHAGGQADCEILIAAE